MPTKIYWDACVFGHHLAGTPKFKDTLDAIVASAKRNDILIVTSTLSCAEMAYLKNYDRLDATAIDMLQKFFRNPYLDVRALDMDIANKAADLVRRHHLGGADAVHVATAIVAGVQCLQTTDGWNEDGTPSLSKKKIIANAANLKSEITIEEPSVRVSPLVATPKPEKVEDAGLFQKETDEPEEE